MALRTCNAAGRTISILNEPDQEPARGPSWSPSASVSSQVPRTLSMPPTPELLRSNSCDSRAEPVSPVTPVYDTAGAGRFPLGLGGGGSRSFSYGGYTTDGPPPHKLDPSFIDSGRLPAPPRWSSSFDAPPPPPPASFAPGPYARSRAHSFASGPPPHPYADRPPPFGSQPPLPPHPYESRSLHFHTRPLTFQTRPLPYDARAPPPSPYDVRPPTFDGGPPPPHPNRPVTFRGPSGAIKPVPAPPTKSSSAEGKPAKRFYCRFREINGCPKSFTTSGHASRHAKIHTAEKGVCCTFDGCAKKFTRSDNMKQHLETHFKNRSRSSAAAAPSTSSRTSNSGGSAHSLAERKALMAKSSSSSSSSSTPSGRSKPHHRTASGATKRRSSSPHGGREPWELRPPPQLQNPFAPQPRREEEYARPPSSGLEALARVACHEVEAAEAAARTSPRR